jgi:hypothetical protein
MSGNRYSFTIRIYIRSIKIKIKSSQPNSAAPAIASKNDHSLRAYWRHASNFYFKRVEEGEFARLDYLKHMLNSPIKGTYIFQEYFIKFLNGMVH